MRYHVTIAGETVVVDLDGTRVSVDGREVEARLAGSGELRHLLLDGRSVTLLARPGEESGQWALQLDGRNLVTEAVDERTRAIRSMTGTTSAGRGAHNVKAPMPGLIVRVEVAEGEVVQPGQGVVIMEAMKMENELKADGGGVVARVRVAPGQAVEKGTVLVEFEAP
jgi:pyruvate carboxylase subunit B